MLGPESPEYENYPKLSDRQRGAAVKKAFLTFLQAARELAQGKITDAEFERATRTDFSAEARKANAPSAVALAGSLDLWNRYNRASNEERRQILIASVLKSQGWLITLQAAL